MDSNAYCQQLVTVLLPGIGRRWLRQVIKVEAPKSGDDTRRSLAVSSHPTGAARLVGPVSDDQVAQWIAMLAVNVICLHQGLS